MKAIAITGGVATLIIGIIFWIWFGPGEAVVAVLGTVALSLIAAWAQFSGNQTARETEEYRDKWINRRQSHNDKPTEDE